MNKYNVRALRNELERLVRDGAWNKFYHKARDLAVQDMELWTAIVAHKSSKQRRNGSLLHIVLRAFPPDVTSLVSLLAIPTVVNTTDANLQTPLHIAIERGYCTLAVQTLLDKKKMTTPTFPDNHPLVLADRYQDTPLIKAVRRDQGQYVHLLLAVAPLDRRVILAKRKQRTALWYAASQELKSVYRHDDYSVSMELQLLLLATRLCLLMEEGCEIDQEDVKVYQEVLHNDLTDDVSKDCTARILCAVIDCASLLEKHAVRLLDKVLGSKVYQNWATLSDSNHKNMFHWLGQRPCRDPAAAATNALLWERALQSLEQQDSAKSLLLCPSRPDGNLPLHAAADKAYLPAMARFGPSAVVTMSNAHGALPLHLALLARNRDGARYLWRTHSDSLRLRHGPTQLYAFALAATQADAPNELSFIYELLVAAPEALYDQWHCSSSV